MDRLRCIEVFLTVASSRRLRSGWPAFFGLASPNSTRWTIHNMYTAARMMPSEAATAYAGRAMNAPSRTKNSPTKLFVPGRPSDESEKITSIVAYSGMVFARPP